MHQFWHTITKIKNSSSYKFELDKKQCKIDVEDFRNILQICPRLPNQEFDALPSNEEIVTFIKELGHKSDIKSVTDVKKALVVVEEPAEKPAARRQSASVQIRDTPGMSVSNKKAPAKAERRKGIELLSEATSLEEARLKKAIKRSKRETNIHQAGGSSEGANLESKVLDEPKGKSID
ncbi:hypothetical protein Tco_0707886, partial [Tanacetum coccineum]